MPKFKNASHKIKIVLKAFREDEKLTGKEIAKRVRKMGYKVNEGHIKMFIYYNMLHKYLRKEVVRGINYYFPAE